MKLDPRPFPKGHSVPQGCPHQSGTSRLLLGSQALLPPPHPLQLQEQGGLSVRQFHYTTWPDHGVPHSPDPLLAFWKVVRHWLDKTPGGGRPIVHCR